MDDPDIYEMNEYSGIEVFVPGTEIERAISGDELFKILLLTGLGFGLTFGITFVLELPMIALGLIRVNLYTGQIEFAPYVFMFLTLAEFGFIIPPIWYIRRKGYGLNSLGLKFYRPTFGRGKSWVSKLPKEIGLGLIVGALMLASNIAITWFVSLGVDQSSVDDGSYLFASGDIFELITWILVMFFVVGISEELLFRGFLQRRMEVFFRNRSGNYRILALAITSLIFAIMHLDIYGLAARFVLGLFMGYLTQQRQYSIIGATVAHGFNNSAVVIFAFLGF